MNKILYSLAGTAVAIAIIAAFFDRHIAETTTATGFLAAVLFVAGLAACAAFLRWTPIGRRFTASVVRLQRDKDDRVRTTPGKVRQPPWWWV
jgi:drug/metabolite transporter (DMT)-like permease